MSIPGNKDFWDEFFLLQARAKARKEEEFIRGEMKRLRIEHYTTQDLVWHGYALQVRQHTFEPVALVHEPEFDQSLQLMDC